MYADVLVRTSGENEKKRIVDLLDRKDVIDLADFLIESLGRGEIIMLKATPANIVEAIEERVSISE